jgi:sucrose-6-phosphate hydrolase SacC (GH32 family)
MKESYKMKRLTLILLALGLAACTTTKPMPAPTPAFIQRQGVLVPGIMESTPFVMHGTLYSMVSARELGELRIYQGSDLVSYALSPLTLASAIVHNDTLYVYGTTDSDSLSMVQTADLMHWTAPQRVLNMPIGQKLFNNSITETPSGWTMAVETCELNTTCFNARFYTSTDLINWTPIGTIMSPNAYAACPTIRYVAGAYYIFYLKHIGDYFATYVARSYDLETFNESSQVVLSTRLYEGTEGINASDMDLVEYQGVVYINYADGNQTTWVNIHRATYNGTLEQLTKEFFP